METSRDDSLRTCAQCGKHMPAHSGGGRQADYCSRSCQAKAYRSRHAHGTARDDSQWAALTARATLAEAESTALRAALDAARTRIHELAAELATLRADAHLQEKPVPAARRQEQPETPAAPPPGTPALPPQIKLGTPRRFEQVGTSAWTVHVEDVPIGRVVNLSGRYWPTLPNGVEVYLGGTADNLDGAAEKLAYAYGQWAAYWHHETNAKLTLLRPRQDGGRTAKWGGRIIGQAVPADSSTGGTGWLALYKDTGAYLRANGDRGAILHYASDQAAAEALLDRWRTEHTPTWGGLVSGVATS